MAHHTSPEITSPAEKKLLELRLHGDDFLKIELLRPAKSYYKKALEIDPSNKEIKEKIAQCDHLLAYEGKVIRILLIAVTVLALAIGWLKS